MLEWKSRAAVVLAAMVLAACGGGGGSPGTPTGGKGGGVSASNPTASADAVATLASAISPAIANASFIFTSGVPEFGGSESTTLKFTTSGNSPSFTVSSNSGTASGNVTFGSSGSCIFSVSQSSFTSPSLLTPNSTITEQPCQVRVATDGITADGQTRSLGVSLVLGATSSSATSLTGSISASGQVTVNNIIVGTVTVTQ